MKTHELANALKTLASALKSGPDVDLHDLKGLLNLGSGGTPYLSAPTQSGDLPIALSALLSLSRIDKQEWIKLIKDLGLDIEIRPRDASRDIVGKVLRILEGDPDARMRLSRKVNSRETPSSPELARALSSLLSL